MPLDLTYLPYSQTPVILLHIIISLIGVIMKYDLERLTDRMSQASSKWNIMNGLDPAAVKDGIVPLSTADMEFKTPPELTQGIKEYLDGLIMGYSFAPQSFKEALFSWLKRRRKYEPAPESLVNTGGVVPALFTAVRAFSNEGDGVVLMPPVYGPFFNAIEKNNRTVLECNLINEGGVWKIDFERLESIFKEKRPKLFLFCSPHNPVGRVWTKTELEKIAHLCTQYRVVLVSDEIHNDLIMPGYVHTVMETVNKDIAENCVICTSLAKTFNIAGVALSSIFIKNKVLRERFTAELDKIPGNVSSCLNFKVNEIAYNTCENWLDEVILKIEENGKLLRSYIEKNIPQVKTFNLEGTYLIWLDFRALNIPSEKLDTFLQQKARLFLTSGLFFGKAGAGYARLNLAAPSFVIKDALVRLDKAVKTMLQ